MKNFVPNLLPNKFYAKLLENLLKSSCGEVASFLTFSFKSFLLVPYKAPQGEVLEKIATDDLGHLKTLGHAITLLGGNVNFGAKNAESLSLKNLSKATSLNCIIYDCITLKEQTVIAYKTAIEKISCHTLKKMLLKIAEEESFHLKTLKNIAENLNSPQK